MIVSTPKTDVKRGRCSTLLRESVFLVKRHSVVQGDGDTHDFVQPIA